VRAKVRYSGGDGSATLVFTRMGARHKVFWVKPEGQTARNGEGGTSGLGGDSVGDVEGGLADDEMVA
jgi:hypothetical protein